MHIKIIILCFTDLISKYRTTNRSKPITENISEVVFEHRLDNQINQESIKRNKQLPSRKIFQNENSGEVMLNKIISNENNDVFNPSHFLNTTIEN